MNAKNPALDRAVEIMIEAYKKGGKLLVCGNGGSASDSAHIVGELVKGFLKKRPLPAEWDAAMDHLPLQMGLPAIDLTAQGAVIAAVVNDLGGELMYAQQVNALGKPGDVFLGISTSGNAKNVQYAAITAKAKGMKVIGLTGKTGGAMDKIADVNMIIPCNETYQIQELHLPVYHCLCLMLETYFFA